MRFMPNGVLYESVTRLKNNFMGYGHVYNMDIGPNMVGVSIFSLDMETVRPLGVISRTCPYRQVPVWSLRGVPHANIYDLSIVEQIKSFLKLYPILGLVLGYPRFLGKGNRGHPVHVTSFIEELLSSTDEVILSLLYTEMDESRTTYSADMALSVASRFKNGKEKFAADFARALKRGKNPYQNPLSQGIIEGEFPFGTPLTHAEYKESDHKDMISACFIGENFKLWGLKDNGGIFTPYHAPACPQPICSSLHKRFYKFSDIKLEAVKISADFAWNQQFITDVDPKVVMLAWNNVAFLNARLQEQYKLKAYVQQVDTSQLEEELQQARQQGIFISISSSGDQGATTFDVEYACWLEEQNRLVNELRSAVNSHASDAELRIIVDGIMAHYAEIFRLKANAAKADVFHLLSGMWKTPAERCFVWLGGFRSSGLLKLLVNQLEALTEHQLVRISYMQQSSQQAEDALSQGMEALQQSLAETLSIGSLGSSGSSGNVSNYMGQMAMAMEKLGTLEGFICQADNLWQQTLKQMHQILKTHQSACALLAIHDYFTQLRALSSLWRARPRE